MNLKKMTRDDFEKMSHLDIAYNIIKSEKKTYKTVDLLKKICKLLEYEENAFENLIGEFYTSLNLDKRFILIDGNWDLTENHSEIEDEAVLDDTEALEDVEDDLDDEMEDLTILTEEELEEEN